MKRRTITVLIVLSAMLLPLAAADYADVSFSFGHQIWQSNITGIDVYYGMNVGLTSRLEASLWGESMLTPDFFGRNAMGLSFSYALLGERSTGSKIAGPNMNTLLNGGIIFTMNNRWEVFMPTDLYLSITPLTVGSPVNGRRERLLEVGVSWNWFTNEFRVLFSLFKLDYYVRGSWRSYEIIFPREP